MFYRHKCTYPLILSNSGSSIQSCFKKHEAIKKRAYESRICKVEYSTFTSLVFSATRGMAHEATIFCKKLSSLLSDKWKEPFASVLGWVPFTFLSYTLISNTMHQVFSRPHYTSSLLLQIRFNQKLNFCVSVVYTYAFYCKKDKGKKWPRVYAEKDRSAQTVAKYLIDFMSSKPYNP